MNDSYQHAKEKEQQSWAILPLGQGKGPHSVSAAVVLVWGRCEQEHGRLQDVQLLPPSMALHMHTTTFLLIETNLHPHMLML
jgi:hypothetical protein